MKLQIPGCVKHFLYHVLFTEMSKTPSGLSFTSFPVTVKEGCIFDIAVADEAYDPVSIAYREGSVRHIDMLVKLAGCIVRPGCRVLDLGAHMGGFCLTAAAMGCEVIAVEASPINAELLEVSKALNHFEKLKVVHAAIAAEDGTLQFSVHGPWGHVATSATNMPSVSVAARRGDDILRQENWESVHFVKMDVEGSEVSALKGLKALLDRPDAPPIYFECNKIGLGYYDETADDLMIQLRSHGYKIYRAVPNSRILVEMREAPKDTQKTFIDDYLAIKAPPDPNWNLTFIPKQTVVVDGVIFQQPHNDSVTLWEKILKSWALTPFGRNILVLDRAGTVPRVEGLRYHQIAPWNGDQSCADSLMLQRVCDEAGAAAFISSAHTFPIETPSVLLVSDLDTEYGAAQSPGQREAYLRCVLAAVYFVALKPLMGRDFRRFHASVSASEMAEVSGDGSASSIAEKLADTLQLAANIPQDSRYWKHIESLESLTHAWRASENPGFENAELQERCSQLQAKHSKLQAKLSQLQARHETLKSKYEKARACIGEELKKHKSRWRRRLTRVLPFLGPSSKT